MLLAFLFTTLFLSCYYKNDITIPQSHAFTIRMPTIVNSSRKSMMVVSTKTVQQRPQPQPRIIHRHLLKFPHPNHHSAVHPINLFMNNDRKNNNNKNNNNGNYKANTNEDGEDDDFLEVEADLVSELDRRTFQRAKNAKPIQSSSLSSTNTLLSSSECAQQSNSYMLCCGLYLALAFDVLFNQSKRALLLIPLSSFSSSSSTLSSSIMNILHTSTLCSGLILASGASFLLSRDYQYLSSGTSSSSSSSKTNGEVSSSTTTTTTIPSKVSSFLSFSNLGRWGDITRTRMHASLLLFGICHLSAGLFNQLTLAPFLGMAANIICFHNGLISWNALRKEYVPTATTTTTNNNYSTTTTTTNNNNNNNTRNNHLIRDTCKGLSSMMNSLLFFDGGRKLDSTMRLSLAMQMASSGTHMRRWLSTSFYQIATLSACLRSFGILWKILIPHYTNCIGLGMMNIAPVPQLRTISLQWASLGRSLLVAGLCLFLKEAADKDDLEADLVRACNGLLCLCAIGAAIPMALAPMSLGVSSGAFKLLAFALLAGSNVISPAK